MNKGMVYTPFAVLAASLLILMVAMPLNQPQLSTSEAEMTRISEASFYMDSIQSDKTRAQRIATDRSLTSLTNLVVETGEPIEDSDIAVKSSTVNGTVPGRDLNTTDDYSMSEWISRVQEASREAGYSYDIEIIIRNSSVEAEGFTVRSGLLSFSQLKDPVTLTTFNRTDQETVETDITQLEDTMLLVESQGRYVSRYKKCSFDRPAEEITDGPVTNGQGPAYGTSQLETAETDLTEIENRSTKVLVTNDINQFLPDQKDALDEFAGIVSANEPDLGPGNQPGSDPGDYPNKVIFNTGTIAGMDQDTPLILEDNTVWNSHFRQVLDQQCYFRSQGPRAGPDFLDRLEGSTSNEENDGVSTLIDETVLPPTLQQGADGSNVGYVFFGDEDFGELHSIEGVTSGTGGNEYYSWFRLDNHHVEKWNLTDITE
jgi:hypothetical protein